MSSQWVNKFAIMRDLSLAQGCLPVDVAGAVGAGERPPTSSFNEDTEEDFYRQWVVGDGDFAAPDLGLIKDMLEMVKNHDSPNENNDSGDIIQIHKLNPMVPEYIPKPKISQDNANVDIKKPKQKKRRNAAMQSLLQNNIPLDAIENIETNVEPIDFIAKPSIEPIISDKIVNWLEPPASKSPSPTKKNGPMLDWNPTSMFKKRNAKTANDEKNDKNANPKPIEESQIASPGRNGCNKYVPSKTAEEYYKNFVQCSEMHRMVEENVWTKVERQMKEIDERRKAEAELLALSRALCGEGEGETETETEGGGGGELQDAGTTDAAKQDKDPIQQKLDLVRLSHHRHQLQRPCAVCAYKEQLNVANTTPANGEKDDPWSNWRDKQPEKVDDSWRIKTPADQKIYENNTPVNKNVADPWWYCSDNQQEKVDANWLIKTTPTDNKNDENNTPVNKKVDDLWWDCSDEQPEKVHDHWHNDIDLTEDETLVEPLPFRPEGKNGDEPWWAWIDDIKEENNEIIESPCEYIVITKMVDNLKLEEPNNTEHIEPCDENHLTNVAKDESLESVPTNDYQENIKVVNAFSSIKYVDYESPLDIENIEIFQEPNTLDSKYEDVASTNNIYPTNDNQENVEFGKASSGSNFNFESQQKQNGNLENVSTNDYQETNRGPETLSCSELAHYEEPNTYSLGSSHVNECNENVSSNDCQGNDKVAKTISGSNSKDLESQQKNENLVNVSTTVYQENAKVEKAISGDKYKDLEFQQKNENLVNVSTNNYEENVKVAKAIPGGRYEDLESQQEKENLENVSTNDYQENAKVPHGNQIWWSLDDYDDIDAWRYEILG